MRDIVLFGNEKVRYDLEYVFEWKNCIHLALQGDGKILINDRLIFIEELDRKIFEGKNIIICNNNRCLEEDLLIKMGFQYQQDYVFAKEILYKINEIYRKAGNRKIAVLGTGEIAKEFIQAVNRWKTPMKIDIFLDNYNMGDINGIVIRKPEEINEWNEWYVVIAVEKAKDKLVQQLLEMGLKEEHDFTLYSKVVEDLEPLLYRTVFSPIISNFLCIKPFGYVDVNLDGIHMCCPYMMPENIGNLSNLSFMESWHSRKARIIRLSVINGTYIFCNLDYCLHKIGDEKSSGEWNIIAEHYNREALDMPDTMVLAFDLSCNLSCPSCREKVTIYSPEIINERQKWADCLLEECIPYVNHLWIAGCGEVFFSKLYKGILEDQRVQSRKNMTILTNGTLANAKNLELILDKYKYLNIMVSLDGIEKNTVEFLRRGSNWETLLENVKYMGRLRNQNRINKLYISFVLQDKNIREFEKTVKWCEEIGVDKICVLKLYPQGQIFEEESYNKQSVFDKNGEIKKCYQKYFTKQLIYNPIIDWDNCGIGTYDISRNQIYDDFDFDEK